MKTRGCLSFENMFFSVGGCRGRSTVDFLSVIFVGKRIPTKGSDATLSRSRWLYRASIQRAGATGVSGSTAIQWNRANRWGRQGVRYYLLEAVGKSVHFPGTKAFLLRIYKRFWTSKFTAKIIFMESKTRRIDIKTTFSKSLMGIEMTYFNLIILFQFWSRFWMVNI